MNEVQIYIIDKGYLDLFTTTDFPLVLKKGIADINDITARDSSFSYDFEIPNNANNNKILFGFEFVSYADKTILGQQDAILYLNGNPYERGFVEVRASKYMDKYVCNFFGGNAEWVENGANILVKDLDWKNNVQPFTQSGITTVNTSGRTINDIFYPFVDRNTANDVGTYRPVFYVRNLFELFFSKIGYTIESEFLATRFVNGGGTGGTNVNGLAVDLAVNFEFDEGDILDTIAQYSMAFDISTNRIGQIIQNTLPPTLSSNNNTLNLTNAYSTLIKDDFNLFVVGTGYTAPRNGQYIFTFDFSNSEVKAIQILGGSIFYITATNTNIPRIDLQIFVNGVLKSTTPINSQTSVRGLVVNPDLFLETGDVVTFQLNNTSINLVTGNTFITTPFYFAPKTNTFNIQFKSKIELGDTYEISRVIPKELKAIDLISDFKLLFNLYFDADIKRKVVKIEPRNSYVDTDGTAKDGYYQSVGLASNWTDLIDYNLAPEIINDLPYNRTLKLRYQADNDDKWLLQWEKNNNRVYGQYIHELGNRFRTGESIIQTEILAPTIQGRTSNVVTSIIRSEYAPLIGIDSTQPTPNNKYAPRIGWIVNSSFVMEAFDDLATFTDASKLTFNGTNGLFERFWSKALRNLSNAVVVKVKVRLTKYDVKNFDFSKPVYISLPQQLAGYYVVQNIEVNMMSDELVSVELLSYKDYSPLTVDPTQRTNINQNTQIQQTQPPNFVLFEDDTTGQLINVLDVDDNGNFINLIYE